MVASHARGMKRKVVESIGICLMGSWVAPRSSAR